MREEIKTQGKRNGNAFFSVLSCVVSFLKIVELTVVLKKEKQNKTKQKIWEKANRNFSIAGVWVTKQNNGNRGFSLLFLSSMNYDEMIGKPGVYPIKMSLKKSLILIYSSMEHCSN